MEPEIEEAKHVSLKFTVDIPQPGLFLLIILRSQGLKAYLRCSKSLGAGSLPVTWSEVKWELRAEKLATSERLLMIVALLQVVPLMVRILKLQGALFVAPLIVLLTAQVMLQELAPLMILLFSTCSEVTRGTSNFCALRIYMGGTYWWLLDTENREHWIQKIPRSSVWGFGIWIKASWVQWQPGSKIRS